MTRTARAAKVTLAQVAERAGVSTTTASFVLSGRTDMRISPATADRVLRAAKVLDYQRPLRTVPMPHRLPVIAFVTDTGASDSYTGEMIGAAVTGAAERGHGMITVDTEGDQVVEAGVVRDLLERGVGHFIYSAQATRTVRLPVALRDRPVVLLNCIDPRAGVPSILPDEQAGAKAAVDALVEAGHRDGIWLVGEVRPGTHAGRRRRDAVIEVLSRSGIGLARHISSRWWPPDARSAMSEALRSTGPTDLPTAVIAMNDRVAMGVYQAVEEAGLAVPTDVSVVSFDNSELSWWLTPELTTVAIPYHDMGRRAVEVLLGAEPAGGVESLPMPLVRRASIAPPAQRRIR